MSKDPLSRSLDLPSSALFWNKTTIHQLQKKLFHWWWQSGRHDLPWSNASAYGVWISEVMLQQTQVVTVKVKYQQWMQQFPTIEDLANAPLEKVFELWEGLGYYSRARNIHKAAQQIKLKHQSQMPIDRQDRLDLPGVGPSTASAIGAFAFQKREAIMDGNVERVWSRWWGDRMPPSHSESLRKQWLWNIAQSAMPLSPQQARPWTQAIMDLGATVCTPKNPKCDFCPWIKSCAAYASGHPTQWPAKKKSILKQKENWNFGWFEKDGKTAWAQLNGSRWTGLWVPAIVDQPSEALVLSGTTQLTHRTVFWTLSLQEGLPYGEVVWLTPQEALQKPWPTMLKKAWASLSESQKQTLQLN